jgi:hypothetical protein
MHGRRSKVLSDNRKRRDRIEDFEGKHREQFGKSRQLEMEVIDAQCEWFLPGSEAKVNPYSCDWAFDIRGNVHNPDRFLGGVHRKI